MFRLKTRAQFQAVLAGSKLASGSHFVVHYLAPDAPAFGGPFPGPVHASAPAAGPHAGIWLGAMAPKRWARRAVTRNAIKRQIYNVARDFENRMPAGGWVVRLRSGFDPAQFHSATSSLLKATVRSELTALLSKVARAPEPKSLQGLAK